MAHARDRLKGFTSSRTRPSHSSPELFRFKINVKDAVTPDRHRAVAMAKTAVSAAAKAPLSPEHKQIHSLDVV